MQSSFDEVADTLATRDSKYDLEAYYFVRDGLDFTVEKVHRHTPRDFSHHVSGAQLSEGLRDFALEQYGPMARFTLKCWGITTTADFGEIVFALIEAGVFSKSSSDRKSDFENVFDWDEAFSKPFEPSNE